jgi:choline monooxygenase
MPAPIVTAAVERYRDPAIFTRERERIFARSWQFICLESELTRTGDYLADTLAGYPVVVVRDEKGVLRGFHNVCRHRAGPLVAGGKGRCDKALVCRFHSWRYGYDGSLREATGFGAAEGFNTADYSLFGIRVEIWRGLVFINLDAAAQPLIAAIKPLDDRFAGWSHRSAILRKRHPIASNWKVYIENLLDGYHLEGVHPGLATEEGAQTMDVRMIGEVACFEVPNRPVTAAGLWAWLWPSFSLSVHRGALMIEYLRIVGPEQTVVEHIFLHEPEDPGVEAAIHAAQRITEEDGWICERVQQNLDAGIYRQGLLSPSQEGAVAWFQQRVDQALSG